MGFGKGVYDALISEAVELAAVVKLISLARICLGFSKKSMFKREEAQLF